MAQFQYDFDPADHFTTGAIGEPGQRTFFLQAGRGIEYVSMICEKEQVRALGEGLLSLLDQIAEVYKRPVPESRHGFNFELVEPVIPAWRISQLGVGYDDERDRIVIIVQELIDEEATASAEVGRFTITREHANAFAYHALEVVAAGRPTCPFCGEPMEPEGHFCSRTNGHDKSYVQ